ncbi:hypothetical protein K435DRAFT_781901 [Dendrothele bispora CBS 962.96]|uniref:Integrase zinc-binding domain-containing protein n=1 Tax=Dendrothele bispora (strain CBS 962.96) TaxID=1314807 RepID=A0A4S8LI68_DENBC|nr:hypothetical protein K435DRAFT_781901 [Dendrothele bispora CBS 962.96]
MIPPLSTRSVNQRNKDTSGTTNSNINKNFLDNDGPTQPYISHKSVFNKSDPQERSTTSDQKQKLAQGEEDDIKSLNHRLARTYHEAIFLPTLAQYETIEASYLDLKMKTNKSPESESTVKSPRDAFNRDAWQQKPDNEKRDTENRVVVVAEQTRLLSSESFEKIWASLENDDDPGHDTSQLHSSASTADPQHQQDLPKFSIRPIPISHFCSYEPPGRNDGDGAYNTDKYLVLMHGDRMVASRERMHDILSFCHLRNSNSEGGQQVQHRSMEETLSVVNKYYAFVPHELVDSFVKICPGCTAGAFTSTSQKEMNIDLYSSVLPLVADADADADVDAYSEYEGESQLPIHIDLGLDSLSVIDEAENTFADDETSNNIDINTSVHSQTRRPSPIQYTSSRGVDLASYADRLRASGPSPVEDSPMPPSLFSRFSSRSSTTSCKSGITFSSQTSSRPTGPMTGGLRSSKSTRSTKSMTITTGSLPGKNLATRDTVIEMTRAGSVPDGYKYHSQGGDDGSRSRSRHGPGSGSVGQPVELLPKSLPMSREVSLFQGLPNGWQYFTDYETALSEFMERRVSVTVGDLEVDGGGDSGGDGEELEEVKEDGHEGGSVDEAVEEGSVDREIEEKTAELMLGLPKTHDTVDQVAMFTTKSNVNESPNSDSGKGKEQQSSIPNPSTKKSKLQTLGSVLGVGAKRGRPKFRGPSAVHVAPLRSGSWANSADVGALTRGHGAGENENKHGIGK